MKTIPKALLTILTIECIYSTFTLLLCELEQQFARICGICLVGQKAVVQPVPCSRQHQMKVYTASQRTINEAIDPPNMSTIIITQCNIMY